MPQTRLNALRVRNLSEPGKYYDENGLFLRVEKSGSKRWVQRLTIKGRQREVGLGSALLVSLSDARAQAYKNRQLARSGGDPLAEKAQQKSVPTFEAAAREVHRIHSPTWKNEKHAGQFITTLETYTFPHMGSMAVGDISAADVLAALLPIWTIKPETARRVKQRIGTVMKWAVAQGFRQDDPSAAIQSALPKVKARPKHRKALPYADVAEFVETVVASGAGQTTKLALEFLILTAARSGEVRLAAWSEIDLAEGAWCVPAGRMKAGNEHRVPLSPRTMAILEEARAYADGSDLVFPGSRKGQPLSDMTLSKLVKSLGYDVDVHGFRTSFRTWAQERTSFAREVVEKALAHTIKNKSEAAYARSDLFEKRTELMNAWATYIDHRQRPVTKPEVVR